MSDRHAISVLHKFGAMRLAELVARMKLNKKELQKDKLLMHRLMAMIQRVANYDDKANGKIFTLKPGLKP